MTIPRPAQRFEVRAAIVYGVALPLLETARRRTNFEDPVAYVDDYLIGGLLLAAAWAVRSGRQWGAAFLCAAWGMLCGGLYYSFFGQLVSGAATDISGLPKAVVVAAKGALYAVAGAALVLSVRRARESAR